jgi:MerR family copper efflux transcriptional regulator
LTAENQAARIAQWRQLLAGAERENVDDGLLFRLPTERAGPVAELAAAEQRCCAFFKFAVRLRDGRVELKVHASPDAAPLLAEVFGTTD